MVAPKVVEHAPDEGLAMKGGCAHVNRLALSKQVQNQETTTGHGLQHSPDLRGAPELGLVLEEPALEQPDSIRVHYSGQKTKRGDERSGFVEEIGLFCHHRGSSVHLPPEIPGHY